MSTRHDFYQSGTHIVLSIYKKGVDKNLLRVNAKERTLSVFLDVPTDRASSSHVAAAAEPILVLEPLYDDISEDPAIRVYGTKIELTLEKSTPGLNWPALVPKDSTRPIQSRAAPPIGPEPAQSLKSETTPAGGIATAPSDSPDVPQRQVAKGGKKNWDDLLKDEVEEKDDQNVDAWFKELYANASEDARRAMMKSYTESGGTALSMNWDDVSKGPVPISPPTGVEAKKW